MYLFHFLFIQSLVDDLLALDRRCSHEKLIDFIESYFRFFIKNLIDFRAAIELLHIIL